MKKKQILSVITFAVLLFGINMLSVRAEMLSGTCGNNLMWMIDEEGIFTIIGNGDIPDAWSYENGEYTSGFIPWGRYKNIIKTYI